MLHKKPAALFATSNAFSSLTCGHTYTPPCCAKSSPISSQCQRRRTGRGYATFRDLPHSSPSGDEQHPWPKSPHPNKPPTPYQIFNQKREEPYSKRRFYELVKLYHPDRNKYLEQSASEEYRQMVLERYRMVIAANAILSDPERKSAYDRFGFGWSDVEGEDPSRSSKVTRYKYTTEHRWRTDGKNTYYYASWATDQDPMYNATWEDWERWYQANRDAFRAKTSSSGWDSGFFSSKRSRAVYMNNYAFFSLLMIMAALGGVGNATRASEGAKSRMEQYKLVNDETSQALMKAREETRTRYEGGEDKRQRIRRFISEREGYTQGEFEARGLKEGDEDYCGSGSVKDRDKPRFWEVPPDKDTRDI